MELKPLNPRQHPSNEKSQERECRRDATQRSKSSMSFVDKLRTQKLLSFTLVLFTLCVGIVIGTLISSGVKAARSDGQAAPGATPLVIPNPVELSNAFTPDRQAGGTFGGQHFHRVPAQGADAIARNGRRQRPSPDEGDRTAAAAWTISSTASSATAVAGPEMPQREGQGARFRRGGGPRRLHPDQQPRGR